jgi:hypothetical protein
MRVVFGRPDGLVALDSTYLSPTRIAARIPEVRFALARDLVVAVLSEDRTELSNPLGLTDPEDSLAEELEPASPRATALVEPEVTGAANQLVWNGGETQQLLLEGVNLSPGMQFEITVGGRIFTVAAVEGSSTLTTGALNTVALPLSTLGPKLAKLAASFQRRRGDHPQDPPGGQRRVDPYSSHDTR